MKKATIGQRILFCTGFLCLGIAGLSAFAVNRLLNLRDVSEAIVHDSIPGIVQAAIINNNQADAQLRALRLLLTTSAEERAALKREIDEISQANIDAAKKYERTVFEPEDRRNFEAFQAHSANFLKVRDRYYELVDHDPEAAKKFSRGELQAAFKDYTLAGDALMDYNAKASDESGQSLAVEVAKDVRIFIVTGILALVIGVAVSLSIVANIGKVLRRVAASIAEGAAQTTSASAQVSEASQALAQATSEQASSLEETGASLEEMASMTKRNADNASTAKEISNQTRAAADLGATHIEEMKAAMDNIRGASHEIAKIVKTIDEIAFQTNILALNAAVEAARAGEAGAGFAVVAEEVRGLAQRSAESAKESAARIEDSVSKSEHGVRISAKVADSLQQIVTGARRMDTLITEIATASNEQSQGIGQLNSAVSQMDTVTQANAGRAEETAAASEELSAQAASMQRVVLELRELVEGNTASATVSASATVVRHTEVSARTSNALPRTRVPSPAVARGQQKLTVSA